MEGKCLSYDSIKNAEGYKASTISFSISDTNFSEDVIHGYALLYQLSNQNKIITITQSSKFRAAEALT